MYAGVATSCKIGPRETREPGYLRSRLGRSRGIFPARSRLTYCIHGYIQFGCGEKRDEDDISSVYDKPTYKCKKCSMMSTTYILSSHTSTIFAPRTATGSWMAVAKLDANIDSTLNYNTPRW